MLNPILIVISVILIVSGLLWLGRARTGDNTTKSQGSKLLRLKKFFAIASISAGGFLLFSRSIDMIFGPSSGDLGHISIAPERVDVFGLDVGITIVYTWVAMAVLIPAALIIRLTVFRNPGKIPSGVQNVIEVIVDEVGKYTKAQAHSSGELLSSYILTIAAFLIMCAVLELFRLRSPVSDISVTIALALMSFILINVYGIKRKGVIGRLKTIASPNPLVFPFKLISEFAIPLSLACRLFGNMLGGFIIVDILYSALGNNAVGIPGVLGLYFYIFHPLIQAFIFVTLTLTFVNEAIE